MKRCLAIGILAALIFGGSSPSFAACSGPTGAEGDMIYNTTHHMMQFCNGTDWVAMAGSGGGGGASSCTLGAAVGEGYCAGSIGGQNLIVTPKGCPDNAANAAACTDPDDNLTWYQGGNWDNSTRDLIGDGAATQTAALASGTEIAIHCDGLTIDGEAWRIPSLAEIILIMNNKSSLTGAAALSTTDSYWSGNQYVNGNLASKVNQDNTLDTDNSAFVDNFLRCVRTEAASGGGGGGGSGPTASDGYFVLAANATDGSMGGLAGANTICLTELTNSDWKNKTTAVANGQLVAGKVRAFLCDGTTCQNGQPNTTYYFASTYDVDTGGATMTTDASGYGPGDNEMWATVSRFGSNETGAWSGFWSGRAASGSTTWPNSSHANRCSGWTSTSGNGGPGQIQFYDGGSGRWARSWVEGCGSVLHLVCFVDP